MRIEIERIISGGQTGADRGAFDAARGLGIAVGGWVPKGRVDENGLIPGGYPNLREAETDNPEERTQLNVRDSDTTLILSHGPLTGGSEFTRNCAIKLGKPWKHVNLAEATTSVAVANITHWLSQVQPRVLNVAGPRASEDPRIYDAVKTVMAGVLMNQNLDILVGLRDSVLSQCGHWDQIRWQVPAWFTTLGTIGITAVSYLKLYPQWQLRFLLALGIFGALCFILLCRLVSYERHLVDEFNSSARGLHIDSNLEVILEIRRPFKFTWPAILLTATFWFLVYTALLTIFLLGWAAWLWWKIPGVIVIIGIAAVFEVVLLLLPQILRRWAKRRQTSLPTTRGTAQL
ncbi:MAG TPA: putative molybdenum carrier protein [Terriglobia bacterium]|nr:putative molybdenum carrier protein [Terriglobia bacterium]